jgi:hypothetical protein
LDWNYCFISVFCRIEYLVWNIFTSSSGHEITSVSDMFQQPQDCNHLVVCLVVVHVFCLPSGLLSEICLWCLLPAVCVRNFLFCLIFLYLSISVSRFNSYKKWWDGWNIIYLIFNLCYV